MMSEMGKKRLVIDLDEADHAALVKKARKAEMTVANFVRQAVELPLQRQGVKQQAAKRKLAPKGE
jgi:hypothetical protein